MSRNNEDIRYAVYWSVYLVVDRAVSGAVDRAVDRDQYDAANMLVNWVVNDAAYRSRR